MVLRPQRHGKNHRAHRGHRGRRREKAVELNQSFDDELVVVHGVDGVVGLVTTSRARANKNAALMWGLKVVST